MCPSGFPLNTYLGMLYLFRNSIFVHAWDMAIVTCILIVTVSFNSLNISCSLRHSSPEYSLIIFSGACMKFHVWHVKHKARSTHIRVDSVRFGSFSVLFRLLRTNQTFLCCGNIRSCTDSISYQIDSLLIPKHRFILVDKDRN